MELTIEKLKNNVLQNSDYFLWTGNVVNLDENNKVIKTKKLSSLNSQSFKGIFEFVYSKYMHTEKIFVELKINPFKIQSGKFFITDFNLLSCFQDNLSQQSLEELEENKIMWEHNSHPKHLINLGNVDELYNPNLSVFYGVNEFTSDNFTKKLIYSMYESFGNEYLEMAEKHYQVKINNLTQEKSSTFQTEKVQNLQNDLEDFKLNIEMYKNSKQCMEEFTNYWINYNNPEK